MHPAGIKFGLSHGLLELNGADVVLSSLLLENISETARLRIQKRKRVTWIWEEAVHVGIQRVLVPGRVRRKEMNSFFAGLDRIVFQTMGPIAEKAKIAERYGRYFHAEHTFYRKMRTDIHRPHMRLEASLAWRLMFRETYTLIRTLLVEYSPENIRHAELLALCQFDGWDRSPNKLTIEDFLELG
jgi:hypothetical protein